MAKDEAIAEEGIGLLDLHDPDDFETRLSIEANDTHNFHDSVPQSHDDHLRDAHKKHSGLPHRTCVRTLLAWPLQNKSLFFYSTVYALIPSFLLPRPKPRRLHPTSYLDGLRGVAALIVVFSHYVMQFWPHLLFAWHSSHELAEKASIWQFPIIRLIHSGHISVYVFFVISGYVLSHKALGLSRQRRFDAFARSLSSSVFRRWARLMLPALAAALCGFFLVCVGAGTLLKPGWAGEGKPYGPFDHSSDSYMGLRLPTKLDSFWAQLADFVADIGPTLDPFQFGNAPWPQYNAVLWTLVSELMGSWVVFVVVLCMGYLRQPYRIFVPLFLGSWQWYKLRWNWAMFLAGIFLAEASYIRSDFGSTISRLREGRAVRTAHVVVSTVLFTFCLYTASWPDGVHEADTSPHWWLLCKIARLFPGPGSIPDVFWLSFTAVTIVAVLDNATFLQSIFTGSFAQYLGDISLSLYMLHDILLLSLGNWLVQKMVGTALNYALAMALSMVVCWTVTFWAADVFWRFVDQTAISLARWMAERCMIEERQNTTRIPR